MIDLKDLLKAGVHFGHKASRWSPKMRPYIWGAKNKVHLIDVSKTAILLERSGEFVKELASNGKSVLWVGTKKPAQDIIKKISTDLNMPFVINRWIGGTLTNFEQVKKAITRLLHLRDVVQKGSSRYKKKEISVIQKEIARLEKNIGGIVNLDFPPAAIIVVDAQKEHAAIRESVAASIPLVAMVDTNTDPSGINFVIPANDDSPRSIEFVMTFLASKINEGKKLFKEKKAEQIAKAEQAKKEAQDKRMAAKAKQPAVQIKPEPTKEKTTEVKEAEAKAEVKVESKTTKKEAPAKKITKPASKK